MNRRSFVTASLAAVVGLTGTASARTPTTNVKKETGFDYDGDELTLAAAPGQVVRGETGFGSGVPLRVRVRTEEDASSSRTARTTVAEDGTFETEFDLSEADPGTGFSATVDWLSIELASASGTVVAPAPRIQLDYDGQVATMAPDAGQVLTGSTDLHEGATVSVRLRSNRAASLFVKSATATVTADGTFETAFDMAGIDDGTMFLIEAYYVGTRRTFGIGEVRTSE